MNPYKIVHEFELAVAEYAGCKYGVAVDNCTNAIFLCAKYTRVESVTIPAKTYPSVPCSIIHAGGKVLFEEIDWSKNGYYKLKPYSIYDAAHVFKKNMYNQINDYNALMCISFSATKPINIGKGGMILTNDEKAVDWFKQARYCGRHEQPLMNDTFDILGWNMYMTPEQAARGLLLMSDLSKIVEKPIPEYPNLSQYKIYRSGD